MAQAPGNNGNGAVRLARLDGLRGLAACMVAFPYHIQFLFDARQFAADGWLLGWFHAWGWTFVDLFFVLSGYVFAHVYLPGDPLRDRRGLEDFAVARFARLYPLHLVMLLLTALFVFGTAGNGPVEFVANLFMLQALIRPFAESFVGPSWSISVECTCYVIFAMAAACGRTALLRVTAAMVAMSALTLILNGQPGGPYVGEVFMRGLLGFFVGQALWHGRVVLTRVPSWLLALAVPLGMALAWAPLSPILPLTLLAWPAALLLALRLPLFGSAPMVWLGDRSYAIYLVNLPLVHASVGLFGLLQLPWAAALAVHGVFVCVSLLLADASLRWIERPARRWLRNLWQSRERGEPASAAA